MRVRQEITLADALSAETGWLIEHARELPLRVARFCSQQYPDARVRRACLQAIGVVFKDDSSFCNVGFTVIPNKPSDVHVRIGSHVSIAPNVTCVCESSANNGVEINTHLYVAEHLTRQADIVICDEAWIGANAVLLPGVTVGCCCVIGAGSVLTRNADDYGIYAGVPAKKIGDVRCLERGFDVVE